jgi:hypothetical protein
MYGFHTHLFVSALKFDKIFFRYGKYFYIHKAYTDLYDNIVFYTYIVGGADIETRRK